MHYWSLYFFTALALYGKHTIKFNWILNLLLAIGVTIRFKQRRWRIAQLVIAAIAAPALLYYESKLPPFSRAIEQAGTLAGFTPGYLMELLGRFIDPKLVAAFAVTLVCYVLLARRIRFTSFVFIAILSVPLIAEFQHTDDASVIASTASTATVAGGTAGADTQDPTAMLNAFYAEEKNRHIDFPSIAGAKLPFDVVILHVCSLAWDDLKFVDDANPTLLNRFDFVFRRFNSGASYSGPAAIRVLRGSCGQQKHSDLYAATQDQCYLFHNLAHAGYDTAAVMNHDGHFDQFAKEIVSYGGLEVTPQEGNWGQVDMRSFDGTPIYDDFTVLSKWWATHRTTNNSGKPLALYYNTISMHDGNKLEGMPSATSTQSYKPRLTRLLDDFDRFINQLEAGGKPVVLILVPEHGAALRGDSMQISGMREIPNPKVTLVPAAIKLIGLKNKDPNQQGPIFIDQPTSYNALFTLLADLMANNPYESNTKSLAERAQNLPETRAVSENDKIVFLNRGSDYVMRNPDGTWIKYDDN